MSVIEQPTVYDELLELLVRSGDRDEILAFQLSREKQNRLDELLEKNRAGTLASAEASELQEFERIEHVVRLLKARVAQKSAS